MSTNKKGDTGESADKGAQSSKTIGDAPQRGAHAESESVREHRSGRDTSGRGQSNPTTDPKHSTDPQEQRKHQGGRGSGSDKKGSQGGEDENGHGDNVQYPQR